jgi:hypothetical protein
MAYFQPKNASVGRFRRVLQWKMFVYFTAAWSVLLPSGIFCGHLVYFIAIYGIFFPILVCCTKKNLATLDASHSCKYIIMTSSPRNA